MFRLHQWWNQPDSYRWLSGYLAARNLQGFTRTMIGGIVALLGLIPLAMLMSPTGPDTFATRFIAIAVSGACAVMAAAWFARWPSQQQSVTFTVVANVCIAAACLIEPDPESALLTCVAFAALAGYAAFFHAADYLVLTLGAAAATAAISAGEIAAAGDPWLAVSKLLIITVGVLVVPFSGQVLVHLLGTDALNANSDPLTGLRNRRGFYQEARHLIAGAPTASAPYFTVVMIDLDRFKQINDTRGHATGDRILVAVADSLLRASREDAVVGRVGGEEFVVAQVTAVDRARETAERLRHAVSSTGMDVTASVGVATVTLFPVDGDTGRRMVGHLIDAADAAMYEAKRSGGDQVCHSGEAITPPL
ncbi:GGDEF domain-containing protein [Mycobacterium sp. PS03-16]|uniref:GGDEF domain-containing protein n=1 Tax=Mycobacterium sp. PS03-16 TaxID=2559611 RepID=UPI001072F223|nr:GGDEF domain-containing protein [Mycobacterium sp. PS03-16]TFV56048.1 GGDEF domain-containing protein [Mycobacterium sp. PS03-16]